jgi:hypothetical protein
MKTRVPETITCVNCNHNVVIKLYKVDTTINSSQGHFHTIYHPTEPAYTVYCINCGHFMTNDPDHAPPSPRAKPTRRAPSKRPVPEAKRRSAQEQKKSKTVSAHKKVTPAAPASAGKPRQQPVKAASKTTRTKGAKKASSPKRSQRKKAK